MANKNSAARIAANNKYNAKAYDRIGIAVHKGKKDVIKAHAAEQGETINAFVTRAIDETMERDNANKEKSPGASSPGE
ncbi:MAG: hypothetical protein LUE89_00400 [Clostridiales bacterium]|nr:hypothetical protein [Clostridiales bacterium]